MNYYTWFLMFIFLIFTCNVSAFDNKLTHKDITEIATKYTVIGNSTSNFLHDKLAFSAGIGTVINKQSVIEWLRYGSFLEDEPRPGCVAANHFHNPRLNWINSRVKDLWPPFQNICTDIGYFYSNVKSNVHWATQYVVPISDTRYKSPTENKWDWDKAREYYYAYLTGKDFQGNTVAYTKGKREEYFAASFRALGQVLHLLQDTAVPAHVRDDFMDHMEVHGYWFSDRYEYWLKNNPDFVRGRSPTRSGISNQMVAKFWDTDTYTGSNPVRASSTPIGLAEYTNANFASKNTFFTEALPPTDVYYHPYPAKTSTDLATYEAEEKLPEYEKDGTLPETIRDKDGVDIKVKYIKKTQDGEASTHAKGATI